MLTFGFDGELNNIQVPAIILCNLKSCETKLNSLNLSTVLNNYRLKCLNRQLNTGGRMNKIYEYGFQ